MGMLISGGRRLLLVAALTVAGIELAAVHPHELAFFNLLVGGPRHGSEWLVDSNLDWGQDLKLLKWWMQEHNVPRINLSYFGTADPAYYGIEYTPLPGHLSYFGMTDPAYYGIEYAPLQGYPGPEPFAAPQLPGYVAVSVTNLRGVYLNERGRRFYERLSRMEPVATVGYSIYIYHVERPSW